MKILAGLLQNGVVCLGIEFQMMLFRTAGGTANFSTSQINQHDLQPLERMIFVAHQMRRAQKKRIRGVQNCKNMVDVSNMSRSEDLLQHQQAN